MNIKIIFIIFSGFFICLSLLFNYIMFNILNDHYGLFKSKIEVPFLYIKKYFDGKNKEIKLWPFTLFILSLLLGLIFLLIVGFYYIEKGG